MLATFRAVLASVLVAATLVAGGSVASSAAPQSTANYPGSNGRIAFVRIDAQGNGHIYTANAQGKDLKKLTSEPGSYSALDWSPDGKKIAYQFQGPDNSEIWVMNANGTGAQLVSNPTANRYGPSWSPDGRYLAVDSSTKIYRIDTQTKSEVLLKDHGEISGTCLGHPYTLPVYYNSPSWSPSGGQIAVIAGHELPPVPVGSSCDFNPNIKLDLGVMGAGGGEVTILQEDLPGEERFDGLPDWHPNGSKIIWQRGGPGFISGVASIGAGGGVVTQLTNGLGSRPRVSPDGTKILVTRDTDADGFNEVWVMDSDGSDLTPLLKDDRSNMYQDWQPTPSEDLEVSLAAFNHDGDSLEDIISISHTFDVELTIKNPTEEPITGFVFAFDAPVVIDDRSTGGVDILSGPTPSIEDDLTIEPEEEVTFAFEMSATANGVAAAHTKVSAVTESGQFLEGHSSLRMDIGDGAEVTKQLVHWVQMETIRQFLQKTFFDWVIATAERGNALADRLTAVFTPEERQQWFGSATGLPLSLYDRAMASLRGVAPEMFAASFPEDGFKGHSAAELQAAYNESFADELGKGVADYVKGYAGLASSLKKGAQDSWSEVMLASYNLFGTATIEEQQQFAAYMSAVAEGEQTSAKNIVNTIAKEAPKWRENLTYLDQALDLAVEDAFLLAPDIQAQMAKEAEWRVNLIKTAQSDPVKFQKEWAKRDAEIANLVLPVILDTIIGGGLFKAGGKFKGLVFKGEGAAVMRAGEAAGVVDDTGKVVPGAKTDIKPVDPELPHGPTASEIADTQRQANWLDKVEGATIVQSTDAGAVYELPNLGGVPEITLDAKAGILGTLEDGWLTASGQSIELAEILKPSSAYRKVDGIAKLELVPNKTGKAAMLDAGAPAEILSEPSVWRAPDPRLDKSFKKLSKPRQQAAINEWNKSEKAWKEYHKPSDPTSKEARLAQCIGKKARVPLDLEPNKAGLQRFVTAEFEETHVVSGNSEAKLIRAKYYELEVVLYDSEGVPTTVNRKTIVDVAEAVPMGPDADAVGVGKVIGREANGDPIIGPLSRAEREFIMPRYTDMNIKARKLPPGSKGAIPDLAEHGTTLIMDDASASVAGKLLARYGVPFLKQDPGLQYLARISKSMAGPGATGKDIAKLYHQLVDIVRSEGGFGQHAVVVTRTSRYLGEIPIEAW